MTAEDHAAIWARHGAAVAYHDAIIAERERYPALDDRSILYLLTVRADCRELTSRHRHGFLTGRKPL